MISVFVTLNQIDVQRSIVQYNKNYESSDINLRKMNSLFVKGILIKFHKKLIFIFIFLCNMLLDYLKYLGRESYNGQGAGDGWETKLSC
jgi:hypothetical protein